MRALCAPTKKAIVRRPVFANAGVVAWYANKLQTLIAAMNADLLAAVRSAWMTAPPDIHADDVSPTVLLRRALKAAGDKWIARFNDLSEEIAAMFARKNFNVSQTMIKAAFKSAGFTVEFKPTHASIEAYRATIQENVGLIKSIPQQYLSDVRGDVWRAVMKGGDLGTLTRKIQSNYGLAHRRAAFIARDQVNKGHEIIERVRDRELGIELGIWQHSHAGKTPRPTHVAMDGKVFPLDKGMWDSHEGEFVFPGELPNCGCTYRAVIPGLQN